MAGSKDTRIVQMQFDNKSFERNIATSQRSLDRFKKDLNFEETSKGLKEFLNQTKNLAFDTLSNNIQKLTDKFTGLGDAGEYVLSRIRASLEGLALQAEQFVKTLTLEQINVGQNKYDALTKSVQTIVASGQNSEKEAYSVMERVMEYTNQTSHSFETMVSQISSLTSMGIPLQKAERLMEGFANASTKAGADAGKTAVALQTYAKALGSFLTKQEFDTLNLTARVITKEWRDGMIEAGLATGNLEKDTQGVIRTAKKFGKQMIVTSDKLESTFMMKWADRKTLRYFGEKYQFGETLEDLRHPEKAMESLGKTAYLTGQRALTFADALNAVKEAVSGGWMTTFRIMFGDLTDAMNLWTGSCNKVIDALDGLITTRNNILEAFAKLGGRDNLIKLLFGEMEDAEGTTMYEGAFGIVDMLKGIGDIVGEAFWDVIKNLIPKDQQEAFVKEVNGYFGTAFQSFDELWNSDWFKEHRGREGWIGSAFSIATENIGEYAAKIRDYFTEVDEATGLTRVQKIQNILTAVGRTIAFIFQVLGGIAHFWEIMGDDEHLGPTLKIILDLFNDLGLAVIDAENDISESNGILTFFESLAEILKPACEIIELIVGGIADLIRSMIKGEQENGTFADALNNVAAVFKKVWGVVMRVARPFAEFIGDLMDILGGLFESGFDEKSIAEAKEKLSAAFARLWTSLKEIFAPLIEGVKQFFMDMWEKVKKAIVDYFADESTLGGSILASVKTIVIPAWNWIKTTFGGIIARIKQIYEEAKNGATLWDLIKLIFAADSVKKIAKTLGDLIKNGGLTKLLYGALGFVALTKVITAFHNISKVFSIIKQFFTDPGSNIMTLIKQGVLGEYEWFSERFLNFAQAVTKLVGAVAILGFLDTNKMIQGVLGLSAIMLAFGAMWLLIGRSKATWSQQMGLTAAFSALATSLGVLMLALIPLMITDWDGMLRAISGLGAVLLELVGFMLLTSYLPIGVGQLRGFIGFAVSIGILMLSLTPLMLTDWNGMLRALVGLGVVMAELLGFMELLKVLGLSSYSPNMKGMYKFALSISILMLSIVPFLLSDWSSMLRAVAGLGLVMAELLVFMELLKVLGSSSYWLNMKGMYKFALSIGILMLSLVPFLLSDWHGMLRAVSGLGIVMAELLVFMELLKVLGRSSYSMNMKGLYKFALGVAILMLSIVPFMLTDWNGMLRAVSGLGIVLAELIVFMELLKVLGLSSYSPNTKGLYKMAIGIGVLVLSLIPFILTDWSGMLRAVVGLGLVLAELIGFMYIIQSTKFASRMDKLGGFLAFAISLTVLMVALIPLIATDWSGMLRAVVGLGIVMAELVIFMGIVKALNVSGGDIAAAVAIALGLSVMAIAMSIAMNEVRNIKWEVITAFTTGLATAMLGMAGAIVILSKIPLQDGIKGILLLGAGIAAIVGILALMVPYLISSVGDSLLSMAGQLELIAGLVAGFTNKISGVDEGQIDSAIGVFDKLRQLMAKVVGWGKYASDLDGFTYAMFSLGTAMEIFNSHVGNVVGDIDGDAQAALKFIEDLSGCAADLDTIAKMNYDALISRISGLGGALYLFGKGAQEAAGLAVGETPDVTGAMAILREICAALNEDGGFTIPENMPSEDKLGTFGAQLAALAMALVEFEKAGSGLGKGTAEALRVIDFFADLKARLIKQDFAKGLGAAIGVFSKNGVDKNQLVEFGANIEQLGLSLKQFAQSTTVIDEATGDVKELNFDSALSALDAFAALRGKLGFEFGPLIQFFIGRNRELSDLASEIEIMGTAIKDVTDKLTYTDSQGNTQKFDKTVFDDAIEVCDKVSDFLIKLQNKMGRVGGLWNIVKQSIVGRTYDFTDLKTQMEAFADSVSAVNSAKHNNLITEAELETVYGILDNVIEYMQTLNTKFGSIGGAWNVLKTAITGRKADFTDLKKQMEAFAGSVTAINNMKYDSLISVDKLQDIYPVLNDIVNYLNGEDGLKSHMESVGGAIDAVKTFFSGRDYNAEDLKKDLTAFSEGVASLTTFNVDANGNTIFSEEGRQATFTLLDSMIEYMNGLKDKLPRVGGIGEFLSTIVNGRASTFQDLGGQLGYLGEGLGKFYKNLTTQAGTGYDASLLSDSLASIESMVMILKQMAFMNDVLEDTQITEGFRTDTINNISAYIRKLSLALGYMANGDPYEGYGGIGGSIANFIDNFMGSLDNLEDLSQVKTAADILNNVTTAITNLVTATKVAQLEDGTLMDFNTIGLNIAQGTANGIREGTAGVIQAAIDMATAAITNAQATLGEASPSKVFMTIGQYISEGAAIGIRNKTGEVTTAADELGQSAVDSATTAMALFAQLMSQDIDANPTITPVLDMSNITEGAGIINGLLSGSRGMTLAGAGGKITASSVPSSNKPTNEYTGQDLSGVYSSIQNLGSRIDSLGTKISNMKIVMNTGALVGQVSDGINRDLGNKITYRRRRN